MAPFKNLSDQDLLSLIRKDDEAAFTEIFDRYHDSICQFLRKYLKSTELSEDICQNVFLKCWEQRAELSLVREPAAWLYTVAKRQALDFLRRASTEQHALGMILASYPAHEHAENQQISRDYLEFIERILETLPDTTKNVFRLCRQQHHTYEEAAEILGISRDTVKKHMVRSMKILSEAAQTELGISLLTILAVLSTIN